MPAKPKSLGWRYSDQSNFDHNQQAIYVWYPHGHLGIGAFGSIALGLGDDIWRRPTSLCVAPPFFDIPALKQLSLGLGLVRSDELNMRASLRQGNSLVVLPGGVAERNLAKPHTMKLIDGRRGFLRIARDLKLPLIPVFGYGENEFFDEPAKATMARDIMGAWHGSLDLPSWSSIKNFIEGKSKPLKVCIGPAFLPVDYTKNMTKDWKMHVELTYELCKPTGAPPLEWRDSRGKGKIRVRSNAES
jgi:hypothetical protein